MTIKTTKIELDEDLLGQVRRILSTSTVEETVEEAFREVVRTEARRREIEALSRMEGMDLDKPEVMARAWSR